VWTLLQVIGVWFILATVVSLIMGPIFAARNEALDAHLERIRKLQELGEYDGRS
jgi:hypothetical protein